MLQVRRNKFFGVVPRSSFAVNTNSFPRYLTASASLCLAALLAACGGSHTATPSGPVPSASTTLQAETGNNTSATNSFAGQTNGNAGAGNVSKLPISSLLYSGATTKIYATWLGWFGLNNHISIGYNSDTAAQVQAQVADMMSRGMTGAIADWYGTANTFIESATTLLRNEAEAHAGQFEFAIMEDKGGAPSALRPGAMDATSPINSSPI